MKNFYKLVGLVFLFLVCFIACTNEAETKQPNVILIMADDMGYECLSTYGSTAYQTPVLDVLAKTGMKFNNVVSQPLCTPTRVKIMTGKYNYRNYDYFGRLKNDEYTFGHVFKEKGYSTCIAGKWQLNGLSYPDEILDSKDSSRPVKLGFDEYSLWQLSHTAREGGRFANPLIEQNGKLLTRDEMAYGPDIFANFVLDFIERKKDEPFFVYYPMVLVHDPFVPTPDSKDYASEETRSKHDTVYFKEMVAYTDKIVGKINNKLKELEIDDNTILIFTGDNGTHPTIYSSMQNGATIRGAKGNTIDHGTHVPLIVSWPDKIINGNDFDGLIEFSDFFATFSDMVGSKAESDGHSFLSLLKGEEFEPRETAFVHYDPRWGKNVNKHRNQFVRTIDYKLYQDSTFYNLKEDVMERYPLEIESLDEEEQVVYKQLKSELEKHPKFN